MKIGLHTFTPYERLFFSRIYPNNNRKHDPQHHKHHHSGIIASEKWGGSEFIPTDNSNLNQLYENWFVYFYSRRATLFSQGYILIIITNMILNIINIIIAVSQLQRSEEGLRRMGSSWTGIELYYTPGCHHCHHCHCHHHHHCHCHHCHSSLSSSSSSMPPRLLTNVSINLDWAGMVLRPWAFFSFSNQTLFWFDTVVYLWLLLWECRSPAWWWCYLRCSALADGWPLVLPPSPPAPLGWFGLLPGPQVAPCSLWLGRSWGGMVKSQGINKF